MYKIIWQFHVKPEHTDAFEKLYGSTGAWAQLFQNNESYVGTELFKNVETNVYLTIDSWRSIEDFNRFKSDWKKEYEALDRKCERLTLSEARL